MKLLHIDSSILGDNSASRALSAAVVKAWQAAEPGVQVTYRDLASEGLNHFSGATLGALGTAADLRGPGECIGVRAVHTASGTSTAIAKGCRCRWRHRCCRSGHAAAVV